MTAVAGTLLLDDVDDVASWINGELDAAGDGEDDLSALDARVGQLLSRVQIAAHDTGAQLEQTIDAVSRAVPRLAYDVQFMRDSALSLHAALAGLQGSLGASGALEPATAAALDRLDVLHTVKGRMEAVRDVLREAESWSTLESEVVALLAEAAYDRAAERLADARRSMLVFQNNPEHESRRVLMVSLQNQLEAALSAALVAAINTTDIPACRRYYSIFAHIQREQEFRNYYNGARREALVAQWKGALLVEEGGAAAPRFTEFWTKFLQDFLALVNTERPAVAAIFPDPQASLSALIQSTFDALSPSLSQRLGSVVEHHSAQALPELIIAFKSAEEFALGTERVMEKLHFASVISPTPSGQHPSASPGEPEVPAFKRRHSKRMSMSMRLSASASRSISVPAPPPAAATAWAPAVFEPFMVFQGDYAQLESRYLDAALRMAQTEGSTDGAARLRERLLDVFNASEDALGRCLALTHGLGFPGLMRALEAQLKACLDGALPSAPTSSGSAPAVDDLALQIDYSDADWRAFQLALHLLETCQNASGRLTALEARLRNALVTVAQTLRGGGKDGAAMQLLQASALNSLELHTLLDSVTVEPTAPPTTAGLTVPPHTPMPSSPSFTKRALPATKETELLPAARVALSAFTRETQAFLQRTMLAPLLALVSAYPTQPAWSVPQPAPGGAPGLPLPSFGLSPTRAMQRLADGLLSLPQLFESYGADDALGFSLATLPHGDEEPEDDATGAWLASLMRALIAQLAGAALPNVRSLSAAGAKQLAYDLEYLGTVVRTFGVDGEELERWREVLDMDEGALRLLEDGGGDVGKMVRKMRGWL
ncbi:hypothetical protein AURDEDRAFT_114889 [Auricularia subglabra TFB-10046 SS5]|nr:hypothetical protein AURDEDRAFT_114889 [Auricularia subglabra TFB-10046 SS5]